MNMRSFFSRLRKSPISCLAVVLLAALAWSSPALVNAQYSNTTVKNATGKPLSLIAIYDDSEEIADLYITGKEATFGANQRLLKGSGYIQALKNRYVTIVFRMRYRKMGTKKELVNLISIDVNRIDWDDSGKTTHITGIKPVAEDWFGAKLPIHSDLQNPPLANGVLTLDIEKIGKISMDIRFGGKGVPLSQELPSVCSTIVGDKVFEF